MSLPTPLPFETEGAFTLRAMLDEQAKERYPDRGTRWKWANEVWKAKGQGSTALATAGRRVPAVNSPAVGSVFSSTTLAMSAKLRHGKARRRIVKADITHISLVKRGANQLPVIYKSEEQQAHFSPLAKSMNEDGEIAACVWLPSNRTCSGTWHPPRSLSRWRTGSRPRTTSATWISNTTARTCPRTKPRLWSRSSSRRTIPRFDGMKDYSGNPVDVTGGWGVVMKVEDEALRAAYRHGEWNGVSMYGGAIVKAASEGQPNDGGVDMDASEVQAMIDSSNEKLMKSMQGMFTTALVTNKYDADTLQKSGVTSEDTADQIETKVRLWKAENKTPEKNGEEEVELNKSKAPVFDGDPTDATAVEEFEYKVKKHEILSKMDPSKPESVREASDAIADLEVPESISKSEGNMDPEKKNLEERLKKSQSRSSQNTTDGVNTQVEEEVKDGLAIGKLAKSMLGGPAIQSVATSATGTA